MEEKITKLIVGLGNPGSKYEKTRHNIGFELVEDFAYFSGEALKKENKFEALVASFEKTYNYKVKKKIKEKHVEMIPNSISREEHELLQEKKNPEHRKEYQEQIEKITYEKKTINEDKSKSLKVFMALPQTYMNDSGRAISKIMKFYKIEAPDLLIIHDDVSLDTGKLRFAFDRGAGGQHGVEDTINCLGGAKNFHRLKFGVGPDPGGNKRADYVLSSFPKKEAELLESTKQEAMHMIKAWLLDEDYQQLV
jgi:aminoacyl-tRNA hydrolase